MFNSNELLSLPQNYTPSYGTAGFRANANLLDAVLQRCGILMALKSAHSGAKTGIVITASHNPEHDNGVKLIDITGEMIDAEWETYADALAKLQHPRHVAQFVTHFMREHHITNEMLHHARVIIGYDTRQSSVPLFKCCTSGVQLMGATVIDMGLTTTPELQFYVQTQISHFLISLIPLLDYCDALIYNFNELLFQVRGQSQSIDTPLKVYVDCANGVGAIKLKYMQVALQHSNVVLELFNTGDGQLNHKCGSDYVEKTRDFPMNMPRVEQALCFSIDGDADRIIGFTTQNGVFKLLSGDKLAVLFAHFINKHLLSSTTQCAIVQTAYANGASTQYIKSQLKSFDVVCTPTGVKHLHHAAKQYDLGIYFEANGHGTVLIKDALTTTPVLKYLACLTSQVTGDALGNLLAVLCIIKSNTCTLEEWCNMYHDMPCLQTPVHANRTAFQTTDADRICLKPEGLQGAINSLVDPIQGGRAFVRPSGTEDCVRIYVEANDMKDVHHINNTIKQLIVKYV